MKEHLTDSIINIAQHSFPDVHNIPYSNIWRIDANAKGVIKCNISPLNVVVVHNENRTGDIIQTLFKILLLPRPPNAVEIGVVKVENWI